jgi:hypothetical protein
MAFVSSLSTTAACGTDRKSNMSLTIRRIVKARRARDNAENPQFKQYWQKVMDQLAAKIS